MKLIHVKDIGSNFYPMYSVEWKDKANPHPGWPEAWNQHHLTESKWTARFMALEVFLSHPRADRRVRVL